MRKKKGILEEIYEFLDYLSKNDYKEDKRKEENLRKRFGEENYKKIYSLIGGRKTGMLGDALYINEEGLRFLEEYERKNKELKYSRLMFISSIIMAFATIGLLIVTGFYAYMVYEEKQLIEEQFIDTHTPKIYIKSIENYQSENNKVSFDLNIINIGQGPGRIKNIIVVDNPTCMETCLEGFTRSTLLVPGEEAILATITWESKTKNKDVITLVINYIGIGKMHNLPQNYTTILGIDKNSKGVDVGEGLI